VTSFDGKVAFVVGGSRGIGLAAARRLAGEGAHVVIFARDEAQLARAAAEIAAARRSPAQRLEALPLDVADRSAVDAAMARAMAGHGAPDLLLNCAGRALPRRFEEVTQAQFEETLRVNLHATWNACAALAPAMKGRGGTIVNTSSMAGFVGVFGYTDYCASKFAVIGFSEALRSELKPYRVAVQVLCPPDTDTPGFAVENATKPAETRAVSASARPMTADQVAVALLRGLRRGTFMIVPGRDGRLAWLAKRLLPGLVEAVMDRAVRGVAGRR
jgi:NAD(P)-dependent dehydrogenase (short-subunit alcohol dehydrogenase family)